MLFLTISDRLSHSATWCPFVKSREFEILQIHQKRDPQNIKPFKTITVELWIRWGTAGEGIRAGTHDRGLSDAKHGRPSKPFASIVRDETCVANNAFRSLAKGL